jgi:hypothetical protein
VIGRRSSGTCVSDHSLLQGRGGGTRRARPASSWLVTFAGVSFLGAQGRVVPGSYVERVWSTKILFGCLLELTGFWRCDVMSFPSASPVTT